MEGAGERVDQVGNRDLLTSRMRRSRRRDSSASAIKRRADVPGIAALNIRCKLLQRIPPPSPPVTTLQIPTVVETMNPRLTAPRRNFKRRFFRASFYVDWVIEPKKCRTCEYTH